MEATVNSDHGRLWLRAQRDLRLQKFQCVKVRLCPFVHLRSIFCYGELRTPTEFIIDVRAVPQVTAALRRGAWGQRQQTRRIIAFGGLKIGPINERFLRNQ